MGNNVIEKPKNFGEIIKKYRLDRNLLIKDFAKIIGVKPDTVINWEKRGVRPCKKTRKRGSKKKEGSRKTVSVDNKTD